MKYSEIRRLLTVVFLGIAFGVGVSTYFILTHSPNGRYSVKAVLLAPELMPTLKYSDFGKKGRYVFDAIEWENKPVALDRYKNWYPKVSGLESVEMTPELEEQFRGNRSVKLVVWVKNDGDRKVFQEVHFSPDGNYMRVQLHEDQGAEGWAYFYRPHIYDETIKSLLE